MYIYTSQIFNLEKMKKTYLLGFSTLLSLAAVAQISAETRTYKLNTTFDGNSTVVTDANSGSQDRAGGDIIWQNNLILQPTGLQLLQ
jgi:hypothetical protein